MSYSDNWIDCKLGDFVTLRNGYAFKSDDYIDEGIPVIRISDIQDGEVKTDDAVHIAKNKVKEGFNIENGDVLVAMSGATTGKIGRFVSNEPALQNQRVGNLLPKDPSISRSFIYYWILIHKKNIEDQAYGGAQPNISSKLIEEIQTKLPPLSEQKRIVAKLDTLFSHLDQLKARLQNMPTLLKQFRQAVLTQAVTGKLTEEWRESNNEEPDFNFENSIEYRSDKIFEITVDWEFAAFGDVAEIKSNLVDPMKYLELPLIAPDNIESKTGKLISKPTVEEIMPISPKHYFDSGVIVYSKIRPYLSKAILADFRGLCSADMYPINGKIDTRYLYYYMLSNEFLTFATTAGERTVLPKINQKELSIIPVPVPSTFKEQKEIVRRVESLFAVADRIEASYYTLQEKIDHLPQAILSKAFRGELVDNEEVLSLAAESKSIYKKLSPHEQIN